MTVLVVGTGPIGIEYTRILKSMNIEVLALGRGEQNCIKFKRETGVDAISGGIEKIDILPSLPKRAIVAVGEAQLGIVAKYLITKGVKHLLIEKPGGSSLQEIREIEELSAKRSAEISIAYNRRFYASTLEAQKIINEDGGVTSFNFEFTEWSHQIEPLVKEDGVKETWFLHNSTHVVDLAFHLGGWPNKLYPVSSGQLTWHPYARYAGAGTTYSGALFSYFADWQGPGRWGIELVTLKNRLILRPLEKLAVQKIGSLVIEQIDLNDRIDIEYKPGYYSQVDLFLNNQSELLSLREHLSHLEVFNNMSPIRS
ncbi:MAG: gfo/Idh/MocA family oxidoreductase [Legionellaceae bacterium]|nr:gfo/Idh/MocA family oxidoreductase [Legionellaceae bacterium]